MYIPAHFRETRLDVLHALMRDHSFATLVSLVEGELFATHLPLLLDADRGEHGTLVGHLARANPHWRSFDGQQAALAIFHGPHAYISPSWYEPGPAVPTWNYSVVHAYGAPTLITSPERVRALLERTVTTFEAGFAEQWSTGQAGEDYITRLAQGIVAFEMPVTRLDGKRKLSQNRPGDVESAAAGLAANSDEAGRAVAALMLEVARGRP